MATMGAGLAGSVILSATAIAQRTPEAPPKTKLTASSYGRGTVIASDTATVAETTAGKIRGRRLGHPFQWKNTLPWHLGPAAKVRILRFKNLPPFRHDRGLQNHV